MYNIFVFGRKFEILKYFFHYKSEQKVKIKKTVKKKKIQTFWCRTEELLKYLDKLKYLCFILFCVVLDSCSVGFSPPRTPHFPRINIPGPAVTWSCPLNWGKDSCGRCQSQPVPTAGCAPAADQGSARLDWLEQGWVLGIITISVPLVCHSTGDKLSSASGAGLVLLSLPNGSS